jgi:hypothetical protein
MEEIQIIAIRGGSNVSHHAISDYKGIEKSTAKIYSYPRQYIVGLLDNKKARAYVKDSARRIAYCGVNQIGSTRFLQTYADGVWTDNLLNLPQY